MIVLSIPAPIKLIPFVIVSVLFQVHVADGTRTVSPYVADSTAADTSENEQLEAVIVAAFRFAVKANPMGINTNRTRLDIVLTSDPFMIPVFVEGSPAVLLKAVLCPAVAALLRLQVGADTPGEYTDSTFVQAAAHAKSIPG